MKHGLYDKHIDLVIRSDNDSQFISHKFEEAYKELKLEHEKTPFKTQTKNTHI
jgi:transposase InsO family protein